MIKDTIKKNILFTMMPELSREQLEKLNNVLTVEFYNLNISEIGCTEISVETIQDNYNYINKFKMDKIIEGLSSKTIEQYVNAAIIFLEFTNKHFKDITKDDVNYYIIHLMKIGNKNITIDGKRKFVKAFFDWCVENEYIDKNPFNGIKKIKFEDKIKNDLTDNEIVLLRDSCKNYKELALIDILLCCGMRVSELVNLKLENINFSTNEVNIYGEKTRDWRINNLSAEAVKHLVDYLNNRKGNSEYVFCIDRKPYGKMDKNSIESILHKLQKRANIDKNCTVHLFRRTVANKLVDAGYDLKTVADYMGHTVATLEKYYLKNKSIKNVGL